MKKDSNLVIYILIFIIVILFVGLMLAPTISKLEIFNRSDDEEQIVETFPPFYETSPSIIIKALENDKKVELSGKTITLSGDYIFNTAGTLVSESALECYGSGDADCDLYIVNDDSDTYYISSPFAVKKREGIGELVTNKLSISGTEYEFYYESVQALDSNIDKPFNEIDLDNTETIQIFNQIFGCVRDKICFGSGPLGVDVENNQAKVQKFYNFINSVQIN